MCVCVIIIMYNSNRPHLKLVGGIREINQRMKEMFHAKITWTKNSISLIMVIFQNNFTAVRKFSLFFNFIVISME
jgi:hypothetical protein